MLAAWRKSLPPHRTFRGFSAVSWACAAVSLWFARRPSGEGCISCCVISRWQNLALRAERRARVVRPGPVVGASSPYPPPGPVQPRPPLARTDFTCRRAKTRETATATRSLGRSPDERPGRLISKRRPWCSNVRTTCRREPGGRVLGARSISIAISPPSTWVLGRIVLR